MRMVPWSTSHQLCSCIGNKNVGTCPSHFICELRENQHSKDCDREDGDVVVGRRQGRRFQMLRKLEDNERGGKRTNLSFPANLTSSPNPGSDDLGWAAMRTNVT